MEGIRQRLLRDGVLLLLISVAVVSAARPGTGKRLITRAIVEHYLSCPENIHKTASGGETCVRVYWTPPNGTTHQHTGGDPGDCFPEGEHEVRYQFNGTFGLSWFDGDTCVFTVTVTVHYCASSPPYIAHGRRSCTGQNYQAYGAVCDYSCDTNYTLHGASRVQCQRPSDGTSHAHWSEPFPSCEEACSRSRSHCWPGDCPHRLARNCVCRPGFKPVTVRGGRRCDLDTPATMTTCQVVMLDAGLTGPVSGYTGTMTDCSDQRGQIINTQPTSLIVKIAAHLSLALGGFQPHILDSQVGVVGTQVTVVVAAVNGIERKVTSEFLNTSRECSNNANSLHPISRGLSLECQASVDLHVILQEGQQLCAEMESFSGGFYTLQDDHHQATGSPVTFSPVSTKKRVCFLYDATAPVHCSDHGGCGSEPLQLSTRLTRHPQIRVHVEGWGDPVSQGVPQPSVAGLRGYRLEVHNVLTDLSPLAVEYSARDSLTIEWNATSLTTSYDVPVRLPEENPRLYAILLKVHDGAGEHGNLAYARRFVLYDNSSTVDARGTLKVDSASQETSYQWQTDVSQAVCVNWTGRFYNQQMTQMKLLSPVKPEAKVSGHYDQTTGLLPVSGTDNVDGIVKFEMSWRRDKGVRSPFTEVDLHVQHACLSEPLQDGQTYTVWIGATDIINNTQTLSSTVHVDHSGGQVEVGGLKGRLDTKGLYAHSSTDLSAMTLALTVSDPHSGIHTLTLAVGTTPLEQDVAFRAIEVQRMADCASRDTCYCPNVGPCEDYSYDLDFSHIVHPNNSQGLHNHTYYITVNATNNAGLRTTKTVDILIDVSPPSVGVVSEGVSDDVTVEVNVTSQDVVHVRWHGFHDEESGVRIYRVVLADHCLTTQEMERTDQVTEIADGHSVTLPFPAEGHYISNVVAYNGAMQPSHVACSDGVTYQDGDDDYLLVKVILPVVGSVLGVIIIIIIVVVVMRVKSRRRSSSNSKKTTEMRPAPGMAVNQRDWKCGNPFAPRPSSAVPSADIEYDDFAGQESIYDSLGPSSDDGFYTNSYTSTLKTFQPVEVPGPVR